MDVDRIRPVVVGAQLRSPDGALLGQVQDLQLDRAGGFVVDIARAPGTTVSVTLDGPATADLTTVEVADLVPRLALKVSERWSAGAQALPGFDDGDWRPNPPPPGLPGLAGMDDGDWHPNPPPPPPTKG